MSEDLKRLAIAVGNAVAASHVGLARNGADNATWKTELKERCLAGVAAGLRASLAPDVAAHLIETPYNTTTIGKGAGRNVMSCRVLTEGTRSITLLADIVDGSWNAACGLPWSASTMLAFSNISEGAPAHDALVLDDFKCGLVVPLVASPHDPAGFYYGIRGESPVYRTLDGGVEWPLAPSDVEDVRQTRCFLDLFTTQSYEAMAASIKAVGPLMQDWADFGRFYGAGMELMALLGRPGVTPGFGGYVAANQKADNLIPTTMLLEGAGMIVTDWWGESIHRMKIMDRCYVAIGANRPLHDHMVRHLSQAAGLR
jgi:hypothetical protein